MRLREIRPAVVESWIADLQRRGDGGPSILRASAVLSAILQRAVVNDLIDSNPVRQVRKPRLRGARQPAPIAPAVVERIRAQLEPHDAALVSTLAYAGLRPESEALPLTWGDVGERTISVHATKTGHTRHVRLLEPLADDLRVWRAASGNPPAVPLCSLDRPANRGPRPTGRTGVGACGGPLRAPLVCRPTADRVTCARASRRY
jgi:site-specific recombinase XerD